MDLERIAKSKIPTCIHSEWFLEAFRIEWVKGDSCYNPHLHCDTCGITAKNAVPKNVAVEVEGYDNKPESAGHGEWFDAEYVGTDSTFDDCGIGWYPCARCDEIIEIRYLDDESSCGTCSLQEPK